MVEILANHILQNMTEYLGHELKLTPRKTEAVHRKEEIKNNNVVIQSQENIRCHGTQLDRNIRMGAHFRKTAEKANEALTNISRLMPNVYDHRECNRKIMSPVVQSVILCEALICVKAMEKEVYKNIF